MKIHLALLVYLCGSTFLHAGDWQPDDKFLDAICRIESNNGLFTHGDDGKSMGYFQIQRSAWSDVVQWRKKRNLQTHDYHRNVMNPQISRIYAANYLKILHDQLQRSCKREPSLAEIYAAYNMGLSGFQRCNYNLAEVNRVTGKKCRMIASLAK